ncbi:serine/threonine-protein kinase VPS15-like isoform X1 [Carex rostrata]
MGNKIARTTQGSATEYYLHELPTTYNLVLVEVVGRGRFLKSVLCKHDEGLVLVKVYFKRGDPLPLKEYEKRLVEIRDIFQNVQQPHVWPFQVWLETDKAAYLLRQYFFGNLHDRLSTRPFLSFIEKKWIAFQLLCAVEQSHSKGVCHGDIKCENVLVTSWNWLYLADFASFKPTYIPDDDPSDFSFFFDTGGRRRCYLAPERFYEHGGEASIAPDAPLKPSMDIFSVGCVIAELFLEGQPLFELSQLLAYRRGQFDPRPILEKIQDDGIQNMILHMIQLDPESRLSCASYLQNYASVIFPNYFSPFLHKFFSCLIPLDPDTRVALTQSAFLKLKEQMMITKAATEPTGNLISESNTNSLNQNKVNPGLEKVPPDHIQIVGDLNSLLKEVEQRSNQTYTKTSPAKGNTLQYRSSSSSKQHFSTELTGLHRETELIPQMRRILKTELNSLVSSYDTMSDNYDITFFHSKSFNTKCEGMVLIASLLCSCMRNVKQPQLRRAGLLLLRAASLYIDDEDRLQHVVPYVIAMLSDPMAVVRCAALDTLCDVLSLVQDFPPSDAMIFPEYILPMLSMLPDDSEESVRICYASNIYKIAITAYRFAIKSQGHLGILRRSLSETVQELVMGPRQTPNVRRALLRDVGYLCYFFGHRQSNDFLLPILPAFLNDRDDQLRATFYEQLVYVSYFVGQRSVEEYLLPYIEPALSDEMEAVIVNVLDCLSMLCKSGILRKTVLLGLIEKARPLLSYPIQWVRRSVVTFLAACSESLGPVDSFVYLSPLVRPFFTREPAKFSSEASLLASLKPPVPKQVFYQVLEDARSSSDMLERQRKIWYNSTSFLNQWETIENNSKKVTNESSKARPPKQPSRDAKDLVSAGKMQFSSLVSPQMAAGNTSFCEVPSEGLPIYSVCIDKRAIGAASVGDGMAWLQPVNRPLGGLSSSVPPKLISSSLSSAIIKSSSNQDVRGKKDGERDSDSSYITASKFQDISIHDIGLKGSSSNISRGDDDGSQSDMVGTPSFTGWRPRGVLVAHLQEHRLAVNDVAVSNDQAFLVSASDDSTVRIWDTRKLEKDISFRSRLTYGLGGGGARALCAEMLRGTAQVVAGASDGTLHLFSVDYVSRGLGSVVERYSGITDVKKKGICEGPIVSLINCATSDSFSQTVMFSTRQCGIHIWDIRSNSDAWKFRLAPEEGYITSLVVGPCGNWFVSGSSRGVLTLWDMRFLVPVNSWNYSTVSPVEKMCLFVPQANSVALSGGRPLVYIAAGLNEVSLWNAENGSCHQVLRTANMENEAEISNIPRAQTRTTIKPGSRQDMRSTTSKYRIEELNEPSPRFPGVRSLLPLPGGDILTAGTDVRIRYWDHASPERSYCVCGPSAKGIGNDAFYDVRSSFGVQVVQEMNKRQSTSKLTQKGLLAVAANDSAGCHRDAVLSLASVKLNQRLLISSSRDGAIKVWK